MELARERLLGVLEKDLIGPHGGPEELIKGERPSDLYLTGILFPVDNRTTKDEVMAENDDGSEAVDDEDGTPGEGIPTTFQHRQNSMGLTFAASGNPAAFRIQITAGRYLLLEPEQPQPPSSDKKKKTKEDLRWQREHLEHEVVVTIDDSGRPKEPIEIPGTELELYQRVVRTKGHWQVTLVLTNNARPGKGRDISEAASWFQVGFRVTPEPDSSFEPRPTTIGAALDEDDRMNALLYRRAREWAVGHNCAATWDDDERPARLMTTWLPTHLVPAMNPEGHESFREESKARKGDPTICFDSDALAKASPSELVEMLRVLPGVYGRWLEQQAAMAAPDGPLDPDLANQAHEHLEGARVAENRIRNGIELLAANEDARTAFQLAQRAIATQRRWGTGDPNAKLTWRPFQLGFQLLTLDGIARPRDAKDEVSRDRKIMDLLWFPTGGGKTEAYLAITAFTLFLRRMRSPTPDEGGGVAVIMRYTLRLLTTQQFERATSLIMACELERRGDPQRFGDFPFSIGLWVGQSSTPNHLSELKDDAGKKRAQQLSRCPACRERSLKWSFESEQEFVVGCQGKANRGRGRRRSSNAEKDGSESAPCPFAGTQLPIWTVDEEVYRRTPSLVIGTVDKFAQVVRQEKTNQLFGGGKFEPPELIIQDELHLISGPLGTVAGIYEAAIDQLCTTEAGVPPKILGSTATIRRAKEQVRALFNRDVHQFPPPVIDAEDSCFAVVDRENSPGRLYAGVTSVGRSPKYSLQAVCASLLQAVSEPILAKDERDPYWTLMTYFNSLRELGGALVMMLDDVPDSMTVFAKAHGEEQRQPREEPMELTSRVDSSDIPKFLDELGRKYDPSDPNKGQQRSVVLATNMISVGMDIPRLGLMVVNGQPKGMAEYIQATSRVGRGKTPGLVVTSYNAGRPRDRSHFESFKTWHSTLYRTVEATSVTPFAPRARDRALHAAIVAIARHRIPGMLKDDEPTLTEEHADELLTLIEPLLERAAAIDETEAVGVREDAVAFITMWKKRGPLSKYWDDSRAVSTKKAAPLLVSAETAAAHKTKERKGQLVSKPTLNSMREVEPAVAMRMISALSTKRKDDDGRAVGGEK